MDKIQTNINKKIKFSLLKVFEYKKTFNESDDPECAICYKLISNKVFVCEKPCGKTFHRDCLKTMIEHIEINTDEKIRPDYKCCYCRRKFNIHDYDLELFYKSFYFWATAAITLMTLFYILHLMRLIAVKRIYAMKLNIAFIFRWIHAI